MARPVRQKKKNMQQIAFTRFMFVIAVFVIWMGGIGIRLFHLQVTQHAWLKEQALDKRQDVKQARALRGSIFDRNDRALAMSLPVKTLYADPTEIADPDVAAKIIAKTLQLDSAPLVAQLKQGKESGKRFLAVAKKLDEDVVQKLNKALDTRDLKKVDAPNFVGLHWKEDQKRSYPYQSLAAQVIGYSNTDDDGKAGIEQSQDDVLHGAIIKKLQERDRLGRIYDETVTEREKPSDIVLTIDSGYQYIMDQALAKGVKAAQAKSGMAIMISVKTGEILGMSNYPTFDPNAYADALPDNIGNKTIQSSYSPGSAFKIVTYGSALERHLFSPDDMINAGNGSIEVANHTFSDPHTGVMSYSEALAHSSNICAIKTAMSVGKTDFFSTLQKMGFGSRTGVELPAETSGIVRSPEKWFGDSLASMAIGYEIGVSALQMTSAFATIANDGIRIQPHIIKEIRSSDEQSKTTSQATQTQVFSVETARNLRKMLRQVVLTGTGKRAQLNGYTAAGKTGTAWKVNSKSKSVDSTKYISSFIGMAPADNPEIVIAVIMDEPKVGARDGGMVSAPVFREIAQQILTNMKVAMDAPFKQEMLTAQNIPEIPETEKPGGKAAIEKPAKGPMTKTVDPLNKAKPRDIKKANDKTFGKQGKLTASVRARDDSQEIKRTERAKLET